MISDIQRAIYIFILVEIPRFRYVIKSSDDWVKRLDLFFKTEKYSFVSENLLKSVNLLFKNKKKYLESLKSHHTLNVLQKSSGEVNSILEHSLTMCYYK
jgi:hypothetical protein